jgi:hypothetical protein
MKLNTLNIKSPKTIIMRKFTFIAFFLCVISVVGLAQTVAIKKIELAGENIIVHYDLDDSNPNNEFQINLYASKDKFAAPLVKVKGDVGPDVKPGTNRKIEWNINDEYKGYKGKISLEIRGKVFVPFVKLRDFDTSKKYKRGKSYDVAWRPGNTNPIHIELYKGSQRVGGELNHPNNGKYTLSIDSKVSKGKDYRLKITDSKYPDNIIYSDYFSVSPKIPLALKVVPILAVAGGLAAVVGSMGGDTPPDDGNNNTSTEIGVPPFPTK